MKTTIDRAGRVVVPKAIRERVHLTDGGEVEVDERNGVIEIVPAPLAVEVIDEDGKPVAIARDTVAPLTDADVRSTLEELRR